MIKFYRLESKVDDTEAKIRWQAFKQANKMSKKLVFVIPLMVPKRKPLHALETLKGTATEQRRYIM